MVSMVSPARSPAASPASKTSATTLGPELYMVRQPKSGLFRHLTMLTPYRMYTATVSVRARMKYTHWTRSVEDSLSRFILGSQSRTGPFLREHGDEKDQGGRADDSIGKGVAVNSVEGLFVGQG